MTDQDTRPIVESLLRPRAPYEDSATHRLLALSELARALGVEDDPLATVAEAMIAELPPLPR